MILIPNKDDNKAKASSSLVRISFLAIVCCALLLLVICAKLSMIISHQNLQCNRDYMFVRSFVKPRLVTGFVLPLMDCENRLPLPKTK